MTPPQKRAVLLRPFIQHYPWGSAATDCLVRKLAGPNDLATNFAESWWGTHPSGPTKVLLTDKEPTPASSITLAQYRKEIGISSELPFMVKALSVGAPLSIQLHPDTAAAAALHASDPKNYPDSHAKPEIAVAISPTEMLCGIISREEFLRRLDRNKSLVVLGRHDPLTAFKALYELGPTEFIALVTSVRAELESNNDRSQHEELILKLLNTNDPNDRGPIAAIFLNLMKLMVGEAVFIEPGIPHAYLTGELIESLANSDNVVRAGLTKKFQDHQTLIRLVNHKTPQIERDPANFYNNPSIPFVLRPIRPNLDQELDGPLESILLSIDGASTLISDGSVLELPPLTAAYLPPGSRYLLKPRGGISYLVSGK
jgi:mannose-6-phosphate isomerase